MPIRNPFARRTGGATTVVVHDENVRPDDQQDPSHPGFERVDTVGSKASSALSIMSSKSQDNGEYKMSVVNDSGVYLPPSPTEEKGLWPRKYLSSRTSTDTKSSVGDIEHFSISRESFDSYRRSFDITARSPITTGDSLPARQSLDSVRFPRLPRSAIDRSADRAPPTAEEGFEDVGLNDDLQKHHQHRKRGFFSKFSEPQQDNKERDAASPPPVTSATNSVTRFLIPGRKRGQSGQGSELGQIDRPKTATSVEAQEVH